MPEPWSATSSHQPVAVPVPSTETVPCAGLCAAALSSRFATSCRSRAGSPFTVRSGGVARTSYDTDCGADRGLGDGALEQVGHPDRLDGQRRHAGVDPREVEQVVDQPAETFGLVEGCLQSRRVGRCWLGLGDAVDEVVEHGAECGQRRPQLVGDVGDEVAPLAVDGGEVLGHRVERPRQLADLVAGGRVHATGVVAARHLPGHLGHLAQG